MANFRRFLCRNSWWLAVLVVGLANAAARSPTKGEADLPATSPRFVYSFGQSGRFLKVDLATLQIAAYWQLTAMHGLADLLPPPQTRRGYGWAVFTPRYDRSRKRLYFAAPKASSWDPEGLKEEEYIILSAELPAFASVGVVDLSERAAPGVPPDFILSPTGDTLFVQYALRSGDGWAVDEYATADWQRKRTFTSNDVHKLFFSQNAYFGSDPLTILDPPRQLHIGDKALVREPIPLLPQVPVSFSPEGSEGLIGARGTRALMHRVPKSDQDEVWTLDFTTGQRSAAIKVPRRAELALSDDGHRILVQAVSVKEHDTVTPTGELWVYHVEDGKPLAHFPKDTLGARGKLRGVFCPHVAADAIFYQADDAVYALLLSTRSVVQLPLTDPPEFTSCVEADR